MRHRALQSPSAWAGRGWAGEWRRDGDTEREERRQNDGVAIKYTAGSEEHAGCCWEAALWWRISAPSLHFFSLFYFGATASEQCLVCSPRFFLSLFPDIFSSSRFLPFFSCPHFFCVHNIFPLRSFFFIFHVFLEYIDFILFNFQPLYLFLFFLSKFSLPPLSFTFLFFFNFLSLSRSSLQLLSFFLSFVLFLSFFLAAHWDVRPPM